jgi:hypothetical protein
MSGKKSPDAYEVLVGLNYPDPNSDGELRAEPGDVVTDLPERSIGSLLHHGYIVKKEG